MKGNVDTKITAAVLLAATAPAAAQVTQPASAAPPTKDAIAAGEKGRLPAPRGAETSTAVASAGLRLQAAGPNRLSQSILLVSLGPT